MQLQAAKHPMVELLLKSTASTLQPVENNTHILFIDYLFIVYLFIFFACAFVIIMFQKGTHMTNLAGRQT